MVCICTEHFIFYKIFYLFIYLFIFYFRFFQWIFSKIPTAPNDQLRVYFLQTIAEVEFKTYLHDNNF